MKRLYFVRHGQTEMNTAGLFSGVTDTKLTKKGKEQAKLTGQQVKALGIDYIICSPLSRAHETAKIIAREIGYPEDEIHINSLFIERNFGQLEAQPWSPDIDVDGFADVESIDSLLKRARMALDFLETLAKGNVLVVSHGAFGRAMRHHVMEDFPFSHPHRLENAEIIQLI